MSNSIFILAAAGEPVSRTPLFVLLVYMGLLLGLGVMSSRLFRGTSKDYFVASQSIGPFMLLMSVFGTTMTGFALVGSSGKAFALGIGTYGLMASWSGLIHSAIFFVIASNSGPSGKNSATSHKSSFSGIGSNPSNWATFSSPFWCC